MFHPFKEVTTYIYVVILSFILVSRHGHLHSFRSIQSRPICLLATTKRLCFFYSTYAFAQYINIIIKNQKMICVI